MSPLRIFLIWAALCLLLAAEAVAADSSPSGWQAVLVAGDNAQPVFDNAVAAVRNWLASGGVPAREYPRAERDARRGRGSEPASAERVLARIAALRPASGRGLPRLCHLARPARRGDLARLWRRVSAPRRAGARLVGRLRPRADRGHRIGLLYRRVHGDAGAEPDRRHRRPCRPAFLRLCGRADLRGFRRVPALPHCREKRPGGRLSPRRERCVGERERRIAGDASEPQATFGTKVRNLRVR